MSVEVLTAVADAKKKLVHFSHLKYHPNGMHINENVRGKKTS
jgi:hypothetical protein